MSDICTAAPTVISESELLELLDQGDIWLIIVWDDPVTTFKQVIDACVQLLGHSRQRARSLADAVDTRGKAVVGWRTHGEAVAIVRAFHHRLIQASCQKS